MDDIHVLRINLTYRTWAVEPVRADILRKYMGGRGLGAYLLTKWLKPNTDPLSPDNHLVFPCGPGSGTDLFFGSKSVVTTRSPLTGTYNYALSSGTFAHHLRKSGFWALDIFGAADAPVYVSIANEQVSIHDARSLWGMEVAACQKVMSGGRSAVQAGTIAIGSAGERLSPMAAVMAEGEMYRAFGRGGAGAVMGAKKLKGIVASGDGAVRPGNEEAYQATRRAALDNIRANPKWVETRRNHGTGADMGQMSAMGTLPTRNWHGGQFEGVEALATSNIKWPRRNISCAPYCPAPCSHLTEITDGPYKGARADGPEYETVYAFGSNLGIDRFDAVVAAAQTCDEAGLDTMSAGVTIGFAMECFERGLLGLKETDGIELRFGSDTAMMAALRKMVSQEGFGQLLAQGTRHLSRQIPGSEDFAMHVKGLELGGYECRGLMGQALQFAVSPRGGCHHAFGLPARTETGDGTRMQIEGKGEYVRKAAASRISRDSLPACSFPGLILTDKLVPDMLSALYGETWTAADVSKAAHRIMTQERYFNMREGFSRKDDALPVRLLNEPKPDGPTKGVVVPLDPLLDDFYTAVGWDVATGNPPEALLNELGIQR